MFLYTFIVLNGFVKDLAAIFLFRFALFLKQECINFSLLCVPLYLKLINFLLLKCFSFHVAFVLQMVII